MSNPNGYNNDVEKVASNIAIEIIQHGTSISNGSELANMYCSKITAVSNTHLPLPPSELV